MTTNVNGGQLSEIEDAVGAANDLYNLIARLKRLRLLSADEDRDTRRRIDEITSTLVHKLSE